MAPRVGLEPTTYRLTAGCSAIELPRINSSLICDFYSIRHFEPHVNTFFKFFLKVFFVFSNQTHYQYIIHIRYANCKSFFIIPRIEGAVALNNAAVPFSCTFFEAVLMQFLMKPLETTAFIKKKTIPASNAGFLTTGQSPCSSRYAYNA